MTYPRTSAASAFGPAADAVTPSPRFPEIEREVLEFWKADDTFRASIAQRDGDDEWVFYDGPPFANGLPHYGHLLTGYVKDIVPRYQTMRGYKVERRFGWDTHGLPAELEVLGPRHARLTLHEGRYHQVRRMFAALGNHVEALHRSRVGALALDGLAPGAWRALAAEDIARVFAPVGGAPA